MIFIREGTRAHRLLMLLACSGTGLMSELMYEIM